MEILEDERFVAILKAARERANREMANRERATQSLEDEWLYPYLRVNREWAKQCFDRAVERGLMVVKDNHYRWNVDKYTLSLFAYFIGRLCGDTSRIEYKTIYDKNGKIKRRKKVIIWVQSGGVYQVPMRLYFGIDARQQRWNINSTNQHAPKGADVIEEILDF